MDKRIAAPRSTPYAPDNQTAIPLGIYNARLAEADPGEISARTGAIAEPDAYILTVLGETVRIPRTEAEECSMKEYDRILLTRYLLEGSVTPPSGAFSAYASLPWGEVYDRNFRARCVNRLAGTYGFCQEKFEKISEALGGRRLKGSGIVYEYDFLPHLSLRFILWPGDEEFPSSAQILFSDNFPDSFSAEDRVVVCEYTLRKMKGVQLK